MKKIMNDKTPMQELLEWVNTTPSYERYAALRTKIEDLIEKEKQVIIEAHHKGNAPNRDFAKGLSEQYYKETFNPKEIE